MSTGLTLTPESPKARLPDGNQLNHLFCAPPLDLSFACAPIIGALANRTLSRSQIRAVCIPILRDPKNCIPSPTHPFLIGMILNKLSSVGKAPVG